VQHNEINLRGAPLRVIGQAAYIRVSMQKYKQIDLKARHQIKALLEAGHSQTKIANKPSQSVSIQKLHFSNFITIKTGS